MNVSWNDYKCETSKTFRNLRCDENFTDVTLVADDNQQIDAHRVILSASSPFFRTTFERNPHQKPLLYLKGIPHIELGMILDYIYIGECQVNSDRLDSFLRVGEALQIDGLTEQTTGTEHQEPLPEPNNKPLHESLPKPLIQQEPLHVFTEIEEQTPPIRNKQNEINNRDIEVKSDNTSEIVCKIGKHGQLLCNVCNFVSGNEHKMNNHIKIHGIGEEEEDNKVKNYLEDEEEVMDFLKTFKENTKTLKIQPENWNIRDRKNDLKERFIQIRTDRLLMKKLKCYVIEQQRPFLSFLRRREEVIMCGDKKRMEKIRETPGLEKAIKDIFFYDLEDVEFKEDIVLPPLSFPFRDPSQGWSAKVSQNQAVLYLHVLDFSGQEHQNTPLWWPQNVNFRVPFNPSYASKEENERIVQSILNYHGIDINNHHL